MKKIISTVLALMLFGTVAANAAIVPQVMGGTLDRPFDEDRTLYYIKPSGAEAPAVTASGATDVTPSGEEYAGLTVLRDNSSGKEYRFVTEQYTALTINEEASGISLDGLLTLKGLFPAPCEVMILRPTLDKNIAYTKEQITSESEETVVFDFDTITSTTEYTYQFPTGTAPGMYKIIVGGANVGKDNQLEYKAYYSSVGEQNGALTDAENATSTTVKNFVYDNRNLLELTNEEITTLTNLTDTDVNKQTAPLENLVAGKTFADIPALQTAVKEAIAVAAINKAPDNSIIDFIIANKDALGITLDSSLNTLLSQTSTAASVVDTMQITNKSQLNTLLKDINCLNGNEVQKTLDNACAVELINEAVNSTVEGRFDAYKSKFGFTAEELNKVNGLNSSQKSKVLIEVIKSDYSTMSGFNASVINNINALTSPAPTYQGGGGGGGGVSIPSYVPDTTTKEPDSEKVDQTQTGDGKFTDIESVPWAKAAILYLQSIDVINGRTAELFEPNDYVTREEFVKLIVVALGIETERKDISFTDVPADAWYYNYIVSAAGEGLIMGIDETTFGSGQTITRQDMAVIIKKACDYRKISIGKNYTDIFVDMDEVADYAKSAVETLYYGGIMNGVGDNRFAPNDPVTRAMAAKVIYSMLQGL